VEELPAELTGIAHEVHVQFPWGSLLRGVINGEACVVRNLHRICAPGAKLTIITALDPQRDQSELARQGIEPPTPEYLRCALLPKYQAAGFTPVKIGPLAPPAWSQLASSWAKRLRGNTERNLLHLVLRATG
jgi:16S rRNA (adenine(1408)-N(1))-methyltransferase